MAYWEFHDYVDAAGKNRFREWLDDQPLKAQMQIDALIRNLEAVEQFRATHVKSLKGNCRGLIELRREIDNVQYRPLAYYGPARRQVTLLNGAIEKGGRFEPKSACETAIRRKKAIQSGFASTCPHEFD